MEIDISSFTLKVHHFQWDTVESKNILVTILSQKYPICSVFLFLSLPFFRVSECTLPIWYWNTIVDISFLIYLPHDYPSWKYHHCFIFDEFHPPPWLEHLCSHLLTSTTLCQIIQQHWNILMMIDQLSLYYICLWYKQSDRSPHK